jgi:raffinose/stachyose/melibiose transport system substrate-binding protein
MTLHTNRRSFLGLAGGAGLGLALTGCSGGDASPAASGAGAGASGAAQKSGPFTFWSMWKEGEPQQKVIARAIDDYEKANGVKVEVEWQGRNNLQKLVPALNTNTVPDLVDGPYAKAYAAMVATQQALGLGEAWGKTVDGKKVSEYVPEKYLKNIPIKNPDGQPWMLPYQIQSDAVWYNAAKYPDIKANPPKTWDEWIALMGKLKSQGKVPLAADGDIGGYNASYLSTLIVRNGGPGSHLAIAEDKSGAKWKDAIAVDAAKKVEQLAKSGYIIDGYGASKWPAQQQKWANDEAVFMFMGSWLPTESGSYAAKGFEYASFPFPMTGTHSSQRADFSGFMIPVKAKNAASAQTFAASLVSKTYQDAWGAEAKGIPLRADAPTAPELKQNQEALTQATAYHQANDGVAFTGYNEKVFWPACDQLFLGKLSANDFIDTMVKTQAEYWKSQGK